jgi:hypothetical protein
MTQLIRTGFFRDMAHGRASDPSLSDTRSDEPGPHQDAIAAYLAAGHVLIATPGLVKDVLKDARDSATPIGPPHYLTDGRYVWPADVVYYVRTYNLRLPVAFVEHAMARGFVMPSFIDITTLTM